MRSTLVGILSVVALAAAGPDAGAQDPRSEELNRIFTEKFLGGRRAAPAPPATPAPTPFVPAPQATPAPVPFVPPAPVAPRPAPAPPAVARPAQFVLAGVVLTDRVQMALLQEPGQPGARFVQVGESIGVYRLTAVAPDRAVLSGPGGEVVVPLGAGSYSEGPPRSSSASVERAPSPAPAVAPPPTDDPSRRREQRQADRLEKQRAKSEGGRRQRSKAPAQSSGEDSD